MSKNKAIQDNETLVGIVTPVQWDADDQVSAVALSATDDEAYWIENGDKFFELVQKRIEASGKVRRDRKETRSIMIKRYRVVEEY
jgi:hypothetical protein